MHARTKTAHEMLSASGSTKHTTQRLMQQGILLPRACPPSEVIGHSSKGRSPSSISCSSCLLNSLTGNPTTL